MVKGLDVFREYFKEYTNQYTLIGGTACSIAFQAQDLSFGRVTKDLDMVLVVESLTKDFGVQFWKFIAEGGYENREKSDGQTQFYRFDKPKDSRFPKMIELFSRTTWKLDDELKLAPLHIDDSISSLSAILLNDTYYEVLLKGRDVLNEISYLRPEWLIPFKAKAWLDLSAAKGVLSVDAKKHRNDIIRLASSLEIQRCELPSEIMIDMKHFLDAFHVTDEELKSLRIQGVRPEMIKDVLYRKYIES